MCEPARKLIRLTALTEFTMSNRKAYNEFARPSFRRDEIDTRRAFSPTDSTPNKLGRTFFGQIYPFFWLFLSGVARFFSLFSELLLSVCKQLCV